MPDGITPDEAEKIRQQEAKKLNGKIDRIETENKTLREELDALKAASNASKPDETTILAKLSQILESLPKEQKGKEAAALAEELRQVRETLTAGKPSAIEALKAEFQQQINDLRVANEAATEKLHKSNLELWKVQAIAKVGKPVIEELVTGNSPEELVASASKSAERYAALEDAIAAKYKPSTTIQAPGTAGAQTAPAAVSTTTTSAQAPNAAGQPAPSTTQTLPIAGSGPEPIHTGDELQMAQQFAAMTPAERMAEFQKNPEKWTNLALSTSVKAPAR